MSRQHFKGRKRLKSWHRGRGEARRWARTELPDLKTGADPTEGTPRRLSGRGRQRGRGDAV